MTYASIRIMRLNRLFLRLPTYASKELFEIREVRMGGVNLVLNAQRAAIFRITHIDNVGWDFEHGLHCRNSDVANPEFRNIGNSELIEKRKHWIVPVYPGGTLSDYVPFYFTPRSPMLYNIKTGYNGIARVPMANIVIYVAGLRKLATDRVTFVLADRHAKLAMAKFFGDLTGLDQLDWRILQNSDFKRDDADPEKMDRYQAEALIHKQLPCTSLAAVVCYGDEEKRRVAGMAEAHGISAPILVKPGMYF